MQEALAGDDVPVAETAGSDGISFRVGSQIDGSQAPISTLKDLPKSADSVPIGKGVAASLDSTASKAASWIRSSMDSLGSERSPSITSRTAAETTQSDKRFASRPYLCHALN